MSKNFFNKIKESFFSSKHESNDKSFDFDKAKRVLFSSKNREELISAVKYINNFNKKYEITEQSPEFIYFERMIKLMKVKIRNEKIGGSEIDESYRVNLSLRNIIKESLDELDWIKDIEPTPPREWGELRVGDVLYTGEKYAPIYLLEIIRIATGWVTYKLLEVPDYADEDEYVGSIRSVSEHKAKDLITDALYWKYYSIV